MSVLLEKIDFNTLKQLIVNITISSPVVDLNNHNHESGIYLLYIDNFEDERIIPFYIGKTVDFQKRLRAHIKDVKLLMNYSYAEYHNKFFWSAVGHKRVFEGKYRPCKMLKYLLEHNCSVDDIKMIILEKCDINLLDEREQYYLSTFLPAFFGFNQIATITEQFVSRDNPEKLRLIIENDRCNFQQYMEYGYSTFNYLHGFFSYGDLELNQQVNLLLSNHLWLTKEELLTNAISAFEKYQDIYQRACDTIKEKFAEKVHNIFIKYKFKSKSRETEVLSVFTNHFHTVVLDDINQTIEYLTYYFGRDKKSRECGEEIKKLYEMNADEINKIILPVKNAFEIYINARNTAIEQSEYSIIFPKTCF